MTDHRQQLLVVLLREFHALPGLDDLELAAGFYAHLREELTRAGAAGEDFEFLTAHLVRNVVERGRFPTRQVQIAHLDLIGLAFARRPFTTRVQNGVVSVEFPPP